MNKHDLSNPFVSPAWVAVALCALVALGGRAAQAQATIVTSPSQLGSTVRTDPYPTGDVNFVVPHFAIGLQVRSTFKHYGWGMVGIQVEVRM